MRLIIINEQVRRRGIEIFQTIPLLPVHEVVFKVHKTNRNNSQNALHWKRLDIIRLHIADSTGQIYSAEDLHEFFKSKFIPAHVVEVGGFSEKITRTTTKLNTKEFSEFMDQIDRYCIERLNLYLPTMESME